MSASYARYVIVAIAIAMVSANCAMSPDTSQDMPDAPPLTTESSGTGTVCGPTTMYLLCTVGTYPNQQTGKCGYAARTGDPVCCTGCLDPYGYCYAGTATATCGSGGNSCASCDDGNPCTVDGCTLRSCTHTPAAGNQTCGNGGVCLDGAGTCCNGCNELRSDGTFACVSVCSGYDTCQGGYCKPVTCAADSDCNDGDPCTTDKCGMLLHQCYATLKCAQGQSCDSSGICY